jgi:hypothetical protein
MINNKIVGIERERERGKEEQREGEKRTLRENECSTWYIYNAYLEWRKLNKGVETEIQLFYDIGAMEEEIIRFQVVCRGWEVQERAFCQQIVQDLGINGGGGIGRGSGRERVVSSFATDLAGPWELEWLFEVWHSCKWRPEPRWT